MISIHSAPRSGSSWLLSIFDSCVNTKCLYQPLFSYAFKNQIHDKSSQKEFTTFTNELKETEDDFCCMKTNYHTNNGKNDILTYHKENMEYLVMKHTSHHYLIEKMIELNKDIKIIGLIRNPENVIESQMKAKHENLQDWLNGSDKNKDLKENYFGFNKWLDLNNYFITLKEKYPNNVYLIKYEDLLKNTKVEIEKVFHFCGIKLEKSTIDFINESMSINDNYDYSVFRKKETLIKRECKLDAKIINHINLKYPRIAIVITINEVGKFVGTTSGGIKGSLSYVNQFLMLYYSIKENWFFNFKIYLIHSRDFSEKTYKILNNLDVVLKKINTKNLLIRPESYLLDINCDYRLVLDADMIALKNPTFNFNYDAQAQYGYFNYDFLPKKVFNILKIKKPIESNFIQHKKIKCNDNRLFSKTNYNLPEIYYENELNYEKKYYPIFNHGAILIKNKYSKILGEKLILYKTYFNTNSGQDVVGFIINDITNGNWTHFNKGFNFTFNISHINEIKSKKKYIDNDNKIELLHYIYLEKNSIYFKKYIEQYYNKLDLKRGNG